MIAGDGPEREQIAADAARSGATSVWSVGSIRPLPATWLAHASMLIFTSRGPESLSRVLIEASALGLPIAAMNTGGTPDIIEDETTGLLSTSPEELAADVRRLRKDDALRDRLGAAAIARAIERFDARVDAGAHRSALSRTRRSAPHVSPRSGSRWSRGRSFRCTGTAGSSGTSTIWSARSPAADSRSH